MKRKNVVVFLLAATVLAGEVMGVTGCGAIKTQKEQTLDGTENQKEAFTVTFYDSDGTTVLNTVEVENGGLLEEYIPEKEGYTFAGWFATPQMSHKFDFSKEIDGDTDLFAGFVSYVEDTRTFAIVGSGTSPVFLESNWGNNIGEAQTIPKEDVDGANVYTITLDLEEGDEFQFAINSSWNHQRG